MHYGDHTTGLKLNAKAVTKRPAHSTLAERFRRYGELAFLQQLLNDDAADHDSPAIADLAARGLPVQVREGTDVSLPSEFREHTLARELAIANELIDILANEAASHRPRLALLITAARNEEIRDAFHAFAKEC